MHVAYPTMTAATTVRISAENPTNKHKNADFLSNINSQSTFLVNNSEVQ